MKKLTIIVGLMFNSSMAQTLVFDDSFTDSGRHDGEDKTDTNWWTSNTNKAIEVSSGSLGLVSGTSDRGIRTTFESQKLPINVTIKASYTFTTPETIGNELDSGFRVAMYNKSNRTGLEKDLSASTKNPNSLYNGLQGYMADYDINLDNPENANINLHLRANDTSGRLIGAIDGYTNIGAGGAPYLFEPNQTYTGTFSLKNVPKGVLVSTSLSQYGRVLSEFSALDKGSTVTSIGMLAFHVSGKAFGSSKEPDTPDNGIDFQNVKIELLP